MGNMLTSKDANDNLVTRTYGAKNELLTETRTGSDASGGSVSHTTRYVYDSENHLRYRISPEGRVTEYRYFSPGALQSIFEYPEHSYPAGTVAPSDTAMNGWRDGLPDRSSVEISIYSYDGRDNLVTRSITARRRLRGLLRRRRATAVSITATTNRAVC